MTSPAMMHPILDTTRLTVESFTASSNLGTSAEIELPAAPAIGNLLIVVSTTGQYLSAEEGFAVAPPGWKQLTGFTRLAQFSGETSMLVLARIVDGTEGTTLSIAGDGPSSKAYVSSVWEIGNWPNADLSDPDGIQLVTDTGANNERKLVVEIPKAVTGGVQEVERGLNLFLQHTGSMIDDASVAPGLDLANPWYVEGWTETVQTGSSENSATATVAHSGYLQSAQESIPKTGNQMTLPSFWLSAVLSLQGPQVPASMAPPAGNLAIAPNEAVRVLFTQAGNFNGGSLAEVELHAAYGGADLTDPVFASIRAFAGSEAFGGTAEAAFNDVLDDFWAGASGAIAAGTSWVAWRFEGTPVTEIPEIVIWSRGNVGDQTPVAGDVQIWDGAAWVTQWSWGPLPIWASSQKLILRDDGSVIEDIPTVIVPQAPGSDLDPHPHWRWLATEAGSFDGGALAEIEFLPAIDGADTTSPADAAARASAGSEAFGGTAEQAYDDTGSTMWAGASGAIAAGTAWLRWDYAAPVSLRALTIRARGGNDGDQVPVGFDLQYSDDGVAWTTLWSVSGQPQFAAGEKRQFGLA